MGLRTASIVCQLVGQKVYRKLAAKSALDQAKRATRQTSANMRGQLVKRHPGNTKMQTCVYCFRRGPASTLYRIDLLYALAQR